MERIAAKGEEEVIGGGREQEKDSDVGEREKDKAQGQRKERDGVREQRGGGMGDGDAQVACVVDVYEPGAYAPPTRFGKQVRWWGEGVCVCDVCLCVVCVCVCCVCECVLCVSVCVLCVCVCDFNS